MFIGVDFDNTIVCYDGIFQRAAAQYGLVPASFPASKAQVRDHLRQSGREEEWTQLQGHVYGVAIAQAKPFAGVADFFSRARDAAVEVAVISHRTRRPYRGPEVDLHQAARHWLQENRFCQLSDAGDRVERVFFEESVEAKLDRIARVGCSHFIDDLPEFLRHPDFPSDVQRFLFDPCRRHVDAPGLTIVGSWSEISDRFF